MHDHRHVTCAPSHPTPTTTSSAQADPQKEARMRAVRSTPPGVTVVDVDEPEGPGELIKITSASICASDLGYIQMGSTMRARPRARRRHRGRPDRRHRGDLRLRRVRPLPRGSLQPLRDDGHDRARRDGRRRHERVVPRAGTLAGRPARRDSTPPSACLVEPTAVAWHTVPPRRRRTRARAWPSSAAAPSA